LAVKGKDVQSGLVKDISVKPDSQRVTARSVSVKLDADKGSREKATTGLGNALKTDRTRIASDKLVAADSVKLDGTKGSREKSDNRFGQCVKD
jgi:hypothetical protein